MKHSLPLIRRCPLVSSMAEKELLHLLTCLSAQVMHCPKGSSILRQGEAAGLFGLLLRGQAQVIHSDMHGSCTIVSAIGEGELFAEAFACAGPIPMPVSVVTVTDCQVLLLEHSRLIRCCQNSCPAHFQLLAALLEAIARKNIQLNQKLDIVMRRTTREKLLAYLEAQSLRTGKTHFTIPFDRQALADYLGVDRSAMSTELARLRQDGLINFHRSDFELLQIP